MRNRGVLLMLAGLVAGGSFSLAQTSAPMPSKVVPSFEYFDRDGSGAIEPEELFSAAHAQWDNNADHFLEDGERAAGMKMWHRALTADDWPGPEDGVGGALEYQNIFDLWDRDGDGLIGREEALIALEKISRHSTAAWPAGAAYEIVID